MHYCSARYWYGAPTNECTTNPADMPQTLELVCTLTRQFPEPCITIQVHYSTRWYMQALYALLRKPPGGRPLMLNE